FLLRKLLRVGYMQGAHGDAEFRHVHGVSHTQTLLAHMLDMRGPRIDEGHVLARLQHVGAGIAANRARSDNGDLAASTLSPGNHVRPIFSPAGIRLARGGATPPPLEWLQAACSNPTAPCSPRALSPGTSTSDGSCAHPCARCPCP